MLFDAGADFFAATENAKTQKEFALLVKDNVLSACMFQARGKGEDLDDVFNRQPLRYKRDKLLQYISEIKKE